MIFKEDGDWVCGFNVPVGFGQVETDLVFRKLLFECVEGESHDVSAAHGGPSCSVDVSTGFSS